MKYSNTLKYLFVATLILLGGCKDEDFITDPFFDKSESEIFKKGLVYYSQRDYTKSIEAFEAFEGLYPLSQKTSYAQKFAIASHYAAQDFLMTKAACERFLLEHPKDIHADYVSYIAFMSDYMVVFNYPLNFIPTNRALRETSDLKRLYIDSLDFFENYSQSPYAPNVARKLPYIRKMIAEHELYIGKYMLQKHQYYGFLHRHQYITKNFPGTTEFKQSSDLYDNLMSQFSTETIDVNT